MVQDEDGRPVKASAEIQLKAFRIAEETMNRLCNEPYPKVTPVSMTYGTFIKCCGRLDLPDNLAVESATRMFQHCCNAGLVSDFVLTQMRYALSPEMFLEVLVKNGYNDSGDKKSQRVRLASMPAAWTRNVHSPFNNRA